MHHYRQALIGVCVFVIFSGCATRTPEEPDTGRSSFLPPTTPATVLANMRNAMIEKNTENFMLCLSDATTRSRYPYVFEPSSEVRARYASLFTGWALSSERQAFLSLISRLPQGTNPSLEYVNTSTAFSSPDSAVYVTDYILIAQHGISSIPTTLTGTMVLTISPETSGLWSITSWKDAKRTSDTVEATWSLIKAQLSN
ncbi:hypothetical protein BH10BAC6_BH10BAC6_06990 [soil metagenome]